MPRLLHLLLHYKPGAGFYLLFGVLFVAFLALVTQYKRKGRVDLHTIADVFDQGTDLKPFWERNPRLQYLDSFPKTSFLIVKDTQTGLPAMLDTAVVINAEVRPTACSEDAVKSAMLPPEAAHLVCFQLAKPDTGAGDMYTGAVSFQLKAKDAQVAQFYRELFQARRYKVNTIRDSTWGIILEAEDEGGNTVARISIQSSFDTANAFFAWTKDLDRPPN